MPTENSTWKTALALSVGGGLIVTVGGGLILLGVEYDVFQQREASVADPTNTPAPSLTSPPAVAESEPATEPKDAEIASPLVDTETITEARIEFSSDDGKIAPGVWDVDANPGYYTAVYTAAGEVGREGCYVHWETYNNGSIVETGDSRCALASGWSSSYWPRLNYDPGTVSVIAKITTDWGSTAEARVDYQVTE